MLAQQRGGARGAGVALEHRLQRLRLRLARDEHQQLARGQDRAQPDRVCLGRHAFDPAEVGRRVRTRRGVQLHDAHAGVGRGARLVERHVPVPTQAEHHEVDRRPVEQRLAAAPSIPWTAANSIPVSSRCRYAR
jgi:hypothetical protein